MNKAKAAGPHWIVWALVAVVAAVLGVYAQTRAFAWDEGWHLVAAQSIGRGKLPYLDFCFPQTPLNAFWNAGWMRVFGETWRTAHGVAGAMTALAVLLTAGYLLRRFPEPGWRLAASVTGVCIFGLNIMVVEFGTIAQAYALCLFLIVSAFLFTVAAVDRRAVGGGRRRFAGVRRRQLFAADRARGPCIADLDVNLQPGWKPLGQAGRLRRGRCGALRAVGMAVRQGTATGDLQRPPL